jgi:hypothetical protein
MCQEKKQRIIIHEIKLCLENTTLILSISYLSRSLITMTWRCHKLQINSMADNCEYVEQTVSDSWQRVVLQLQCWARGQQLLILKYNFTKHQRKSRTLMESLAQPKKMKTGAQK